MSSNAEPGSAALELWSLLGLPGQVPAANFLTSPNAHQYRLIVRILVEQQAHSLTGVSHDDVARLVREHLPEPDAAALLDEMNLDDRLAQLVRWGACEAWQDRAETEADFLRNRSRCQVTEAGAYLHDMARRLETELGPGSTAALMAPSTVAEQVEATLAALRADDPARANAAYATVQTALESMALTASAWQAKLAAALGGPPDESKVTRLLETILAYVEAWGSGVDAYSSRIAAAVPTLQAVPDDIWRRVALARLQSGNADHVVDEVTRELAAVAETLSRWFCGPLPQAQRLRRQMRDAIAPVLRSHRTLLAVGGTVSRKADLVRLAHAIEAAPDADAAWSLWASATSLFSARHLTRPAPEVAVPARTPVWEAPPVAISQRLRVHGHRSLTGRVARMADLSDARTAARYEAARERADQARAEAELVARSGTALSAWAPLDAAATEIFLALLMAAREGRHPDGTLAGTSPDGRWTLRLVPVEPPATAVIHTPDGRLALADAIVEVGP